MLHAALAFLLLAWRPQADGPDEARGRMVEQQIIARGVSDPRVLDAMRAVPRHRFVDASLAAQAYSDQPLPIGNGQTISQPYIVAYMTEALELEGGERVLEVGTGSGFMAALLAHRAQAVTSLECRPVLAATARANLARNGVVNVQVIQVDAAKAAAGQGASGPFDVILLSGSVAEVPRALLQQLKTGGRLAAVVGQEPIMRARLFTRVGEASWSEQDLFDTVAPRLQGFGEPTRFHF
jgi:protein-L-isoaspartate(D-aspartate) O-methyltransferase